jgi:hypothetical protein
MKKLTLSPDHLRVDSFPTESLGTGRRGTVQGHITTTRPYTCPECANTVYDTCDCRVQDLMARAIVTTRPQYTCPECASPVND